MEMDLNIPRSDESLNRAPEDSLNEEEALMVRSKTSLRMNYEAQVEVLKKQLGSLEDVRLNLGLSQRKMAQLLLVDPSSWTRWIKSGDAPTHIWRALQWYMALREKIPGLTNQYFLAQNSDSQTLKSLNKLREDLDQEIQNKQGLSYQIEQFSKEKDLLERELGFLKKELNFQRKLSIVITLTSMAGLALIFIWKGL